MTLDKSRALKALLCLVLGATVVPIFLSIRPPDVKVSVQSDGLAGISISSTSIIPFVIAASFTRITDDDKNLIMRNGSESTTSTRESILALIQDNPGIHFRDICRQLKKEIGVVQYHVYILQKFGHVTSTKDGRYTRYFVKAQQLDDVARVIISAWQRPVERSIIVTLLDDKNPASIKDMAFSCSVTTQAINWHVNRLKENHILTSTQDPLPMLGPGIKVKIESLIASGIISVAD